MKRKLFLCVAMLAVLTCSAQRSVQVMKDGQLIAEFYERDGWEFIFNNGNGQGNGQQPSVDEHEAVDLGLTSGLKWASCNVGASDPYAIGDFFAWGETSTYYEEGQTNMNNLTWKQGKEAGYVLGNYFDLDPTNQNLFLKYKNEGKHILDPEDDVAHVKWGGDWRMPTPEEYQELIDECDWYWTDADGDVGYRIVSKNNGNWIFLPATGSFGYGFEHTDRNTTHSAGWSIDGSSPLERYALYWTSAIHAEQTNQGDYEYDDVTADALIFLPNVNVVSTKDNEFPGRVRETGCSVRPVCP